MRNPKHPFEARMESGSVRAIAFAKGAKVPSASRRAQSRSREPEREVEPLTLTFDAWTAKAHQCPAARPTARHHRPDDGAAEGLDFCPPNRGQAVSEP